MNKHRILFVCLGNICRSPMAEYLCRSMAAARGLPVHTASAGTSGWHDGEGMHRGTRAELKAHGIAADGFSSRKIRREDPMHYDLIIAMDDDNLAELERQFGSRPGKQFKLTDLIPDSGYQAVPDPWYTGDFAETFRLVSAAAEALLDRLETAG